MRSLITDSLTKCSASGPGFGMPAPRGTGSTGPPGDRGRSQDCHSAQRRRVLGDGLPGNRTQQGNGTESPSQLAHAGKAARLPK